MSARSEAVARSQRRQTIGTGAFSVITAAAVVLSVLAGFDLHDHSVTVSARSDVVSAARLDAAALESYGAEGIDTLVARNSDRMTKRFRAEYAQQILTVIKPAVVQRHIEVVTAIDSVALESLNGSQASVLVAADRVTYVKKKPSPSAPYRLRVKLVKTDDCWLVDDISSV